MGQIVQDENFDITIPADILASNSAGPTASAMLTKKFRPVFFKDFQTILWNDDVIQNDLSFHQSF